MPRIQPRVDFSWRVPVQKSQPLERYIPPVLAGCFFCVDGKACRLTVKCFVPSCTFACGTCLLHSQLFDLLGYEHWLVLKLSRLVSKMCLPHDDYSLISVLTRWLPVLEGQPAANN